jgi:hypothetical protein
MGKVYREFSRQKYNKYKAQFPKLRESEIVSKIIKEWDALDSPAKDNLQKAYEKKNYLTNEDISSSEALMKADLASKEARNAAEKAAKRPKTSKFSSTRIHSNVRAASREGSDVRGSEHHDSRFGESSSLQVLQKTKPIGKHHTQSDYITFFKHHYKNLASQHKRWTTTQITKVIRLLWQKSKKTKTLRRRDGQIRTSKPLSGRRFFRKIKNLSSKVAKHLWVRLPLESKKIWENKSKEIEVNNTEVKGQVKYGPGTIKGNSLSWIETTH